MIHNSDMTRLRLSSSEAFLPVVISAGALLLYALTVARTISWGDSADLAMRLVYHGDTMFVGTYRDYVLWRFVGQTAAWLPFTDAGLRANLFTAFWGAVTVGALAWFVQTVSGSRLATAVAATALTFSHTFWLVSVIALPFTFNAALVTLTYAFVAKWWHSGISRWLWGAAVFAGLSLTHLVTGLVLAASLSPLILLRIRTIRFIDWVFSLGLWAVFSSPYWLKTLPQLGTGKPLLVELGLEVPQDDIFFERSPLHEALRFSAFLTYNFVGVSLLLGVAGLVFCARRRVWPVLPPFIWAAPFVYVGVTSSIPDKQNVYVLTAPVFAIFVGFGAFWLENTISMLPRHRLGLLLLLASVPTSVYWAAAKLSKPLGIDLVHARVAPMRNNDMFFLWPPKNNDYSPRLFAEKALNDMPQGGILIADYTLWRPLYFIQAVEHVRPDIKIQFVERILDEGVVNWIARQNCQQPVFLATIEPPNYYQLDQIRTRYQIVRTGSIFQIERFCEH